jgi:AcrR family transcriptional regulator
MSVKPRTRDKQADATRTALMSAARRLFASRGYPEVSVDEIVQAAKVTKGALYHHFRDKEELFKAVFVSIGEEIRQRLISAAARPRDGTARLRAACHEYLDACIDDEVGRIVVLDSPAVLGWETWCKLSREFGLGLFMEQLHAIQGRDPSTEKTAQVLLGALNVAGRVIAQAEDRRQARKEVGDTIDRLLAGVTGQS